MSEEETGATDGECFFCPQCRWPLLIDRCACGRWAERRTVEAVIRAGYARDYLRHHGMILPSPSDDG